jgi:large subunit ribosomal protein L25
LETFELHVSHRTITGKGGARRLRREGRIPAVLYGPKTDAVLLAMSSGELQKILSNSSEHAILQLVLGNEKRSNRMVMIKELQMDPVTQEYLHIDFYEISMDKAIKVKIPVALTGKAKGSEKGGLVQLIRNEIEVSCLPSDVPKAIEIDVTDLDIGDSVHIEDISVIDKVKLIADTNFTVVSVLAPTVEAVVEEEGIEEGIEEAEQEEEGAPEESTE